MHKREVLCMTMAAGRLDAEVLSVTRRVGELLQKLPRDINPVNLEELRRIKQALVELENKVCAATPIAHALASCLVPSQKALTGSSVCLIAGMLQSQIVHKPNDESICTWHLQPSAAPCCPLLVDSAMSAPAAAVLMFAAWDRNLV
jgi:hypothetical protein